MFFGFLGLINGIVFFPILVILSLSHAEPFSFPDKMVLLYLSVNAFIGTVLSDFYLALECAINNPIDCDSWVKPHHSFGYVSRLFCQAQGLFFSLSDRSYVGPNRVLHCEYGSIPHWLDC